MLLLICGIQNTTQINLPMKQNQAHRGREQTLVTEQGCGRGMNWELGISRCKLLYIEWINSKILLYSTGNYLQSPETNYNGKEYTRGRIYYITESHCYPSEIGTTLYFNFFKKAVYYFLGELQRHFHQERQGCLLSLLLFNIDLEVLKPFSQKHNSWKGTYE